MKTFKEFISEATITTGKNGIGTDLMLGASKQSVEFAKKVFEASTEVIKFQDKFKLSKKTDGAYPIIMGLNKNSYFVQSQKNKNKYYEVIGTPNVIDKIFSYVKGRGKGGKKFEYEFKEDLVSYMSSPMGEMPPDIVHVDVIEKVADLFKGKKIDLQSFGSDEFEVRVDGGANSKRPFVFKNNKVSIGNSTGEYLTDVTLICPKGTYYFSLKLSESIYAVNASLRDYIENGTKEMRANIYDFFGLNGAEMGKGFGENFSAPTTREGDGEDIEAVKKNITNVINAAFGKDYIMVHKFAKNDVFVADFKEPTKAKITSDLNYRYPGPQRKYANISCVAEIHGFRFNVNLQFRDTKGGVSKPTYLRVNLVKKKK